LDRMASKARHAAEAAEEADARRMDAIHGRPAGDPEAS